MSADDPLDEEDASDDEGSAANPEEYGDEASDVRERLEEGADRAAQQIDESVVDLLAWILDTETRARIYVELRQNPDSTSEEIADGTGLYPSTVREALAELHEEGKLERRKRESDGAGNNPYEYRAMAPTELVRDVIGDVQSELNTVFNLDNYLGGEESDQGPVKINVEEEVDASGGDVPGDETDAGNSEVVDEEREPDVEEDTEMVDATEEVDSGAAGGGDADGDDRDDDEEDDDEDDDSLDAESLD